MRAITWAVASAGARRNAEAAGAQNSASGFEAALVRLDRRERRARARRRRHLLDQLRLHLDQLLEQVLLRAILAAGAGRARAARAVAAGRGGRARHGDLRAIRIGDGRGGRAVRVAGAGRARAIRTAGVEQLRERVLRTLAA